MPEPSDDHLVRYLAGDLPPDESERLDERSVTDGEFSLRLRMIENDLVDRYARGEPFDAALQQLDRVYRASPHLRYKVTFARELSALQGLREQPAGAAVSAAVSNRFGWWVAAAAVVAVVGVGYLSVRNVRLREQLTEADQRRSAAERQNTELRQQVERTPTAPALVVATFQLPPPRRGIGTETIVSIPRPATEVTLQLQVELDSPGVCWAALRNPASGRIVWRSADVAPEAASPGNSLVVITVPATVFGAQRYAIDLFTMPRGRPVEVIGQYPIRVVLE
jgi:hypothetical protein